MDIVKFNEKYSHVYDENIENLPSKRYEGLGSVVKTFSYEGEVCVAQEESKIQMYQDVYVALKIASATANGNVRVFEKTVNDYLNNLGYLSDCELKTLVETDQMVGEKLKEFYVKGKKPESESEREF